MTMASRSGIGVAGLLMTLALAVPAYAQGKSGQAHGKKPAAPPPTTTTLPSSAAPASGGSASGPVAPSVTPAAPFAWMDDASLLAPGAVWLGVSMVSWHGGGINELVAPVFDGSIGITPRVQVGASVPRVSGTLGTSFYTVKIAVLENAARGVKVAIGPTLEVLSAASMQYGPADQSRTQWGLPVSVNIDRGDARLYGSSGYFSPGIWYAGAGIARSVSDRVGVSASFSRAWTRTAFEGAPPAARRNDISGGASCDITPSFALYGSVGRTIATSVENGAGTTLSVGLSVSAGSLNFTK